MAGSSKSSPVPTRVLPSLGPRGLRGTRHPPSFGPPCPQPSFRPGHPRWDLDPVHTSRPTHPGACEWGL